jgi:hypothetical protein
VAITLGILTFDEGHTSVVEKHEEVGGRDGRRIELQGLILGEHSVADVEARLDAILDASSVETYETALVVRGGRRTWVRRVKFTREISRTPLVGSFTLELEAEDPFEESIAEQEVEWIIAASGATKAISSDGNVFSKPRITLVADGDVVNPSFSDGTRSLAYLGTVGDGDTLEIDGPAGDVTLGGVSVTPYTSGCFPRIEPEGTTLTYTDDVSSSHSAAVTVAFRNRWW